MVEKIIFFLVKLRWSIKGWKVNEDGIYWKCMDGIVIFFFWSENENFEMFLGGFICIVGISISDICMYV